MAYSVHFTVSRFGLSALLALLVTSASLPAFARSSEFLTLEDGGASAIYSDAMTAEKDGKLARAETLYKQASILPGTQETATVSLARVLAAENKLDSAKQVLKEYVGQINPFSADAHIALVDLYLLREQVEDADREIGVVEKLRPGYEAFQERRGILAFRQADYKNAIQMLSHVISSNPTNTNALALRSKSYAKIGQYSLAASDRFRLTELEPGLIEHYLDLYALYEKSGDLDRAVGALRLGLMSKDLTPGDQTELAQKSAEIFLSVAKRFLQSKDYERGKEVLKEAMKLEVASYPVKAGIYFAAGEYLAAQGNGAGARKFFQKALDHDPTLTAAGLHLADLSIQAQDPDQALGVLAKVLAVEPSNEAAGKRVVALLERAGRNDKLGLFLRDFVDANPGAQWAITRYTKLLASIGKLEVAEAALDRAIEDEKSSVDTFLLYAKALDREKKSESAINVLKRGIQKFPNDPRLLFDLGLSYERAGKPAAAQKSYLAVNDSHEELYFQSRVNLALLQEGAGNPKRALKTLITLRNKLGASEELQKKIQELQHELQADPEDRSIASEKESKK